MLPRLVFLRLGVLFGGFWPCFFRRFDSYISRSAPFSVFPVLVESYAVGFASCVVTVEGVWLLFWFAQFRVLAFVLVPPPPLFRCTGDPVVSIGSIGTPRCAVCLRLWVVSCPVVPACSSLWLVFAPVRLLSMFGSPSRAPFPASAVVLFFCPISVGYFRLDHSLPTCRVCVPDYSPAAPRSDREEVVGRVRWILKFSFAKPGATYRSPFFLRHGELCGVRSSSIRVASSASVSYFVAFSLCVYRWSMFSDSDSECYVSRVSCFHFERCNCACCMRPICSAC